MFVKNRMDGVKKRRREKSQKGFLLALEWLKGNLDLSSVGGGGLDEVVGEQRKKRKNSKRGKIVKNSEGKKGVVRWREEARGRKLDGRGQRSSREDRQRRTPVRTKFSCTRCGALSATLYLFKKHVASCRVEPEWTGTERVFCSGCKVDRDDGREMLECDNCHVWEHTSCNGITDPTMEWFCEACRVAASESAKVVANGKVFETVHEDLSLCEKCLQGDDPANLFLCDSCNRGYHTYCMLPGMALPSATDEEWFCSPRCRQNINEFEKKLRQEIKVENEQLRRQQSQVDMAQGFAESVRPKSDAESRHGRGLYPLKTQRSVCGFFRLLDVVFLSLSLFLSAPPLPPRPPSFPPRLFLPSISGQESAGD